ncbi:MAG: YcaO-like family protein, partial [Acidobacteriota bacterium]
MTVEVSAAAAPPTPVARPTPDYDRLVDERFGVVLGLHPKELAEDEPASMTSFHGWVNNSRKLGQWYGDRISLGTAFHDPEAARRAAIGEAVERYCGNFIPRTLRKASWNELADAGEDAIDPLRLALYSERQYALRGFPFERFTRELSVFWAAGRNLTTGGDAWIPASLVYPNFLVDALADEPQTHFVNLAGIATGIGREDAERSALEEVIERDAVTIWWLSGGPPKFLDLTSEPVVAAAMAPLQAIDPRPLAYQLFQVENVFDVPVIGALLRDPKHDLVTLGVACRPDPAAACLKALAEAVHLRGFSREMLEPEGRIWQMMERGLLNRRVYKPYRHDRRYTEDYRQDWHDV